MYEPESDSASGVLRFLGMDELFSCNGYGDSSQHAVEVWHEHYARESYNDTLYGEIDNDEVIAHALQEELSELSVTEAAEPSHRDTYVQASTDVQPWSSPSRNYYTGTFLAFSIICVLSTSSKHYFDAKSSVFCRP